MNDQTYKTEYLKSLQATLQKLNEEPLLAREWEGGDN